MGKGRYQQSVLALTFMKPLHSMNSTSSCSSVHLHVKSDNIVTACSNNKELYLSLVMLLKAPCSYVGYFDICPDDVLMRLPSSPTHNVNGLQSLQRVR